MDLYARINEIGEVTAESIYNLRVPIREKIVALRVADDQDVKQGEDLLGIDSSSLRLQEKEFENRLLESEYNLRSWKTNLNGRMLEVENKRIAAENALKNNKKKLSAAIEMVKQGLLSEEQKAFYESQVKSAELAADALNIERQKIDDDIQKNEVNRSAIENIKLQLEIVRKKIDECRLKSPIAGKIVWLKKMSIGDILDPSEVALRIAEMNKLEIRALLFESDIWRIESGTEIYVRSGEEKIAAKLKRISKIGESVQGGNKFPCYLDVDNVSGRFRLGSSVEVVFQVDKRSKILAIPLKYLLQKAGIYYVQILNKGKKIEVPVEIGIDDTKYIEIKSGLKQGDTIVYPSLNEASGR